MRSFVLSIIIAVIVVWGSLFFVSRIEGVSDELRVGIEQISAAVWEEDYDRANELTQDIEKYMNKEKLSLAAIMDHTELDKIESSIAELEGHIECKMKEDAIAKCKALEVMVNHMPKNYKAKIENIL